MYDSYSYGYDTAALGAAMGIYYVIGLVVGIIMLVAMWKLFVKADRPGWGAIIPFYNFYLLFDIAWGKGVMFLLMLVPCVGLIFYYIALFKLAQAYGKGAGFGVGMIFLPFIFMPILAFGDSTYQGPA